MYPFIELPRERSTRPLLESRGVPEICQSAQDEIKIQRDMRGDRASLTTLPPLKVPANRGKFDLILGPGVQIPERRPGEIGWMDPPRPDAGSIETEVSIRNDIDNYFGRISEAVPPQRYMLHTQEMIDGWLIDMKLCLIQTFALVQQYMLPEEDNPLPDAASPEATPPDAAGNDTPVNEAGDVIRGRFDLTCEFDARLLDNEALAAKMDFIAKTLIPLDSFGVIDRANLIKYLMASVDQNLADLLVQDIGVATQKEIEDEQVQFAKIAAGTEPPLKEGGQPRRPTALSERRDSPPHDRRPRPSLPVPIAAATKRSHRPSRRPARFAANEPKSPDGHGRPATRRLIRYAP